MKFIDRYLQNVRINIAKKYIRKNDSVLDIGCADGIMLKSCRGLIKSGIGIDSQLSAIIRTDFYTLLPGSFPEACPQGMTFDVITMLAVLEHIPSRVQLTFGELFYDLLNKNGRVIITVPSPSVDRILSILKKLNLIEGMSLEQHYGFKPEYTTQILTSRYFRLLVKQKFQFGLNNLFVFEKLS